MSGRDAGGRAAPASSPACRCPRPTQRDLRPDQPMREASAGADHPRPRVPGRRRSPRWSARCARRSDDLVRVGALLVPLPLVDRVVPRPQPLPARPGPHVDPAAVAAGQPAQVQLDLTNDGPDADRPAAARGPGPLRARHPAPLRDRPDGSALDAARRLHGALGRPRPLPDRPAGSGSATPSASSSSTARSQSRVLAGRDAAGRAAAAGAAVRRLVRLRRQPPARVRRGSPTTSRCASTGWATTCAGSTGVSTRARRRADGAPRGAAVAVRATLIDNRFARHLGPFHLILRSPSTARLGRRAPGGHSGGLQRWCRAAARG